MGTVLAFLAYVSAWIWFYWDSFPDLVRRWSTEDYSYCWLVPVIVICLVIGRWRKQGLHPVTTSAKSGYFFFFLSLLLYVLGKYGAMDTLIYGSMWLSTMAMVLFVFGSYVFKTLIFPIFLLGFAIPPPPFLNRLLSFKLRLISSDFAVQIMQFLNISVFREGNVIDLGVIQLHVVDACSGLRYLFPTLFISLLSGYLINRYFWQRALVFLAAAPISILTNAVRLALVGILAQKVSVETAENFFHDLSGLLVYVVSLALLFGLSLFLNIFSPKQSEADWSAKTFLASGKRFIRSASTSGGNVHTWIAAVVLLVLVGVSYLGLGGQVIPTRTGFTDFPMRIGVWKGERFYYDADVLKSLGADDYVTAVYKNDLNGGQVYLLVSYYDYQQPMHTAHNPVSCLLGGGGWSLLADELVPPGGEGRPFAVRRMLLDKPGARMLAAYWFQQRGRFVTNEFANKAYLALDGLMTHRTDGALVRVEMSLAPEMSVDRGWKELEKFIVSLNKILPAYVPGRKL